MTSALRIVFMGTPQFAVESLAALKNAGFNIVAVVTVADKPAGRGQQLQQSPVKQYAVEQGIAVLQPLNLKSEEFITELASYKADLQFVVAFRMLPEQVWNMPRLGTYNLHASLLPRYRGAAPINHAILNGDTESGVTTFKLQHQIDTGNVLLQARTAIGATTTAGELHDTLMVIGAKLIVDTAKLITEHDRTGAPLQFKVQDDALATHAPKIFREHCVVDWHKSREQVLNQIRGLSPYPAAYTTLQTESGTTKILKIYKAQVPTEDLHSVASPGSLYHRGTQLLVRTETGWIELMEIQLEGKKRMPVQEFLKGVRDVGQLRLV